MGRLSFILNIMYILGTQAAGISATILLSYIFRKVLVSAKESFSYY